MGNSNKRLVLIYDGDCGLCQRCIDFLAARDRSQSFRFLTQQSEDGQNFLQDYGVPLERALQTVVLIDLDAQRVSQESMAVLLCLRQIGFPWSTLAILGRLVPGFIRDSIYIWVANNRQRFGGGNCAYPESSSSENTSSQ